MKCKTKYLKDEDLYYVEDILMPTTEGGLAQVVMMQAEETRNGEPSESLVLRVSPQLLTSVHNSLYPLRENSYVYYDPSNNQTPFANGNLSTFARSMRGKASYYVRQIENNVQNRIDEGDNARNFECLKECSVRSYHVNTGHGNCSILLYTHGAFYTIWMVDCNTWDFLDHTSSSTNIEACFDEIATFLNVEKTKLHISRFMLTHTHNDHYNGLAYLFNRGYVSNRTIFTMNIWYGCYSSSWVNVLKFLATNRCMVFEPIRNVANGVRQILFPDVRVQMTKPLATGARLVTHVNDSSVVYHIRMAGKSMILPGDLEQGGLKLMNQNSLCSQQYHEANYYCVSHHASITGHIDRPCLGTRVCPDILDCKLKRLSVAIVMGRDNAFPGIYHPRVIQDFGQHVVFSERDAQGRFVKFVELDWLTDQVHYHY